MCQIINITGENVISFNNVGYNYNGRNSDTCSIPDIISQVRIIWNRNINNFDFPEPSLEDIILIESNIIAPSFRIEWQDGNYDNFHRTAAITLSRKRKIILTNPLPNNKTSQQVFAHELGHWCFDRYFDQFIDNVIPRTGYRYRRYTEATAFFIEESITNISNDCNSFNQNTLPDHYHGCRILRRIERNDCNTLNNILNEYFNHWQQRPEHDEAP